MKVNNRVSQEEVNAACLKLKKAGLPIDIHHVKQHLNKGRHSTLANHIQVFLNGENPAKIIETQTNSSVNDKIKALEENIKTLKQQVETLKKEKRSLIEKMTQLKLDTQDMSTDESRAKLEAENKTLKQTLTEALKHNSTWTAQLNTFSDDRKAVYDATKNELIIQFTYDPNILKLTKKNRLHAKPYYNFHMKTWHLTSFTKETFKVLFEYGFAFSEQAMTALKNLNSN